jgi:hypothetical protein
MTAFENKAAASIPVAGAVRIAEPARQGETAKAKYRASRPAVEVAAAIQACG